jgi:F0F1-type ATP synthase membrane subunit b/b'
MGLKDTVDKAVDNVKDTTNEAIHRSTADSEKAKRELAGNTMTTGEKVGSMVNQAKNSAQAEVDKAKRDVRNNT